MRQAIITRYHGPTNYRGTRVSARASAGKITIPWDHALDSDHNHAAAAEAFARKFEWYGEWFGGGCPEPMRDSCVFVMREFGDHDAGFMELRSYRAGKTVTVRI